MTLFCPRINQKYANNGRARPVGNHKSQNFFGTKNALSSAPRGWPLDAQRSYEKLK